MLLKSIYKSTNNPPNGNCRLLASSSINNTKKNLKYSGENSNVKENTFMGNKKRFDSFNKIDSSKLTLTQNRNSHYDSKDIHTQSPLLDNGIINSANLQINNSESDSFSNDENSKSTLFTYSIDESNLKPTISLNKPNPMNTAIYYC